VHDRRLRWLDAGLIVAAALAIGGIYLSSARPGVATLTLWSCGGNYDSLSAFARGFEQRHQCRVCYTAAPVQFLLEQVAFRGGQPDLIVGRAGPGWAALDKLGKLAEGPDFFAADPYVIITPPGNPASIQSIRDLGRPGVRIAYSPHAMRPKGKCPAHLIGMVASKFFPGLDERWENNAVVRPRCGRQLPELIVEGRADAAVVARSMTAYAGVRDSGIEIVPIEPKHLDAMRVCRATIGQCVGVLKGARQPDLARQFRDEMLGDVGRQVFEEYGYLHISSPEVERYRPFIKIGVPKRMPPWQVVLGDRLAELGIEREAIRRYLKVIHTFGPNEYEAYSRDRVGELLLAGGNTSAAARQWRRLVRDFPRPGPQEYASPVFEVVSGGPKLALKSEQEYVVMARHALRTAAEAAEPCDELLVDSSTEPPSVMDGDPPANGKREFALAEDLFLTGDYEFATRDYLKVLHLCYPSRYRADASFKVGVCAHMRLHNDLAAEQWRWTAEQFPNTEAAARASAALEQLAQANKDAEGLLCPVEMPAWQPAYDTWPERGMTYGMALYEHRLPLFALKEMLKLIHDVYKPSKLKAEARYRGGICAFEAGHPRAAILEWRICHRDYPDNTWARQSAKAIERARAWPELSAEQTEQVERSLGTPLPSIPKPDKPSCWQRYNLGEELLQVEILDEGQAALEFLKALTVTHASKGKYDESVVDLAKKHLEAALCSQ
jgi:ABC-type molybdate transport system substrate-binding protein/tetratricopeptide (TPR) repeat protein